MIPLLLLWLSFVGLGFPTGGGQTQASPQPSSPLIDALYQASRQESEKTAAPFLEKAQDLLTQGADVTIPGSHRRTALHWAIIGAMSARGEKPARTYVDVVEQLLARGADVNAEDEFGATPLDYQENSPATTELTFLLLDNDARNGSGRDESARLRTLLENLTSASTAGDTSLIRAALTFDLPIGTALQVRLSTPIGSNTSRAGDVIEAVVTAPVLVEGRVKLAPKTRIQGTVMLSQKAANDFERAQLILSFANLIHLDNSKTPVLTRLVDVDNARESVQAGRILGLPHPNYSKLTWGLRALVMADPVLSYSVESALFVRDKEYKRAIAYAAGTDMTVTIETPVTFGSRTEVATDPSSVPAPPDAALVELVQSEPVRTETPGRTPSDLTNLLFIGSKAQVEKAFHAAGWSEAAEANLTSDLKTFAAVAESRGYRSAPVSLLLLDGQKPDVVYQKQTNTFAKRHHIRIWRTPATFQNADVWIAAATHDIGIGVEKAGREWFHRIDPQVDRERSKVTNDLAFAGAVRSQYLVDRPKAPRDATNATGDKILTDGKMAVLILQ